MSEAGYTRAHNLKAEVVSPGRCDPGYLFHSAEFWEEENRSLSLLTPHFECA